MTIRVEMYIIHYYWTVCSLCLLNGIHTFDDNSNCDFRVSVLQVHCLRWMKLCMKETFVCIDYIQKYVLQLKTCLYLYYSRFGPSSEINRMTIILHTYWNFIFEKIKSILHLNWCIMQYACHARFHTAVKIVVSHNSRIVGGSLEWELWDIPLAAWCYSRASLLITEVNL